MAYRFTNTEKWTDSWFSNLTQIQMLLFMYLCDNCDIAGFIEINYKRWANDLNSSVDTIQGALKGLERGLKFSKDNDCIFVNKFLKHQKNLPLNEKNKAHLGIIRRFELYSDKFDIQDINQFIEGANKGLTSPTGIGNGKGIGNGNGKSEKIKIEIPLFEDFKNFVLDNEPNINLKSLEYKYNAWRENGWKDGNNKPIKNWKTKILNTLQYIDKNGQNKPNSKAGATVNDLIEVTAKHFGNNDL